MPINDDTSAICNLYKVRQIMWNHIVYSCEAQVSEDLNIIIFIDISNAPIDVEILTRTLVQRQGIQRLNMRYMTNIISYSLESQKVLA